MSQQKPKSEIADKLEAISVKPTEYSLILGVRRIKEGSFAGLWELTELTGDVSVKKVITDANTRAIVISLAARTIGAAS